MSQLTHDLTTHPSLLLRLRNHEDKSAWIEFVRVYGPMIFGYCRLKQLQESDAADVSQEVFARLSNSFSRFEYQPELGRFRDWLARVVYRELLRFWNRSKRKNQELDTIDFFALSDEDRGVWHDHFQAEILQSALGNIQKDFTAETWQAFHESWTQQRTPADVANQLGIGIEIVYVAKSRVLKRLRAEVVRLTDDLPIADF